MERQRLKYLLDQYTSYRATTAEVDELNSIDLASPENRDLMSVLLTEGFLAHHEPDFDSSYYNDLATKVLAIDKKTAAVVEETPNPVAAGRIYRFVRWYGAAAAVVLLLMAGLYFYSTREKQQQLVSTVNIPRDVQAPVTSKAMITLADGSSISLDSMGNGQQLLQGNIKLIKLANGQIVYQTATGEVSEELQYNSLTNPVGSKVIDMQLSDGSHVWLNAGSSLVYPVAFTGNERKVELKGEGYFEIAQDPLKRFVVKARGTETVVLGTHFNVTAYDNESETKITLLEGKVRVMGHDKNLLLKPGQQAVAGQTALMLNTSPDLDQVMAWKQGYFNFDNVKIREVMRQLERWYAISVVYEGKEPEMVFGGNINRNITLNDVLLVLAKSGIQYKWDHSVRRLTIY